MIELDLPHPPSANHYYRRVGPRTLISREGRRYRERVCAILAGMGLSPFYGPLAMEVEVFPPDDRRRDIDNLQKSRLDSLQHGGLFNDDSQIVKLSIEKRGRIAGGAVIVRVQRA